MRQSSILSADFGAVFSRLPVPILLVDDQSQLLCLNDSAAALFRMSSDDLDGQYWAGLDAQLTLIQWKRRVRDLLSENHLEYETDILTGNEYLRPVQVTLSRIGENQNLVALTDRLPELLAEGQIQLYSEETEAGYWFYNRVDRKWYISPLAAELLGLSPGYLGKDIIEGIKANLSASHWAEVLEVGEAVLRGGDTFSKTIMIEGREGSARVKVRGKAIHNDLHLTLVYGMVEREKERVEATAVYDGRISGELASFTIDQARDMIFWTGPDGSVTYANQTVLKKLKYSLEEMTGLKVFNFTKNFGEEDIDNLYKVLRTEKSVEGEFTLVSRRGEEIEISAVVNYLRFGDREYACSFCRDITKRKAKEQRRRLSEFTIDGSSEMVVWSNPDGSLRFVNGTFLEKTGYAKEEAEALSLDRIFTHITPEGIPDSWDTLSRAGTLEKEVELIAKDGTIIPVAATLNHLVFEGREFNCSLLRDLRDQKRQKTLIELSHQALDSAGDCILWLDGDYRVHFLNQTLLDLLDYPKDKLMGRELHHVFPSLRERDIVPGSTLDVTFETEGTRYLNLKCSELRQDGKHYFMLIGRDVTEMSERQGQLESAYTEIRGLQDRLLEENFSLREEVNVNYNINDIITVSSKYQKVLQQVGQVADTDTTVLITGETGTGKELLARAVHQLSDRAEGAMIKVNCAALPENLIESELFGHEKGAFTGAFSRKKGRFEIAHGGTIFLDEVGELPLELQSKLLRVLQEGEFERVGGGETIRVDVRLVAATNRDLAKMVAEGRFRADLFYRLNVFPINNLPLRDRPEDIPVLVEHFARKFAQKQGKTITKISKSELNKLQAYAFPGNIRELENMVERAVVLANSETLRVRIDHHAPQVQAGQGKLLTFNEMQRKHIIDALKKTGGRITGPEGAGVLLDLNDRTLVSKMRKLNIKKRDYLT